MKKILLVFTATLFTSCSVVRDNPVDKEGDSYVDPTFEINSTTISDGGINDGNDVVIDLEGNTNFNLFQYKLGKNDNWSSYSDNSLITINDLAVGEHYLEVNTKYSDHDDTCFQAFNFLVIDSSSLYLSPFKVTTDDGQMVELCCQNIPTDVVTMHVKFNNVLIDSASMLYSASANIKLLYSDSVVDIASLPGGENIGGTKSIASLKLKDFTGAAVSLDVKMYDKSNHIIECDSTFGLVIK